MERRRKEKGKPLWIHKDIYIIHTHTHTHTSWKANQCQHTHTHCIDKPTDYVSLVVSNELLIHSHLVQYLDARLANSITTVLVSGKFLLLQQKNLSPQISQVVAECRARRPGSDYYYIIVGRFNALKVSKASSESNFAPN